MVTVTAAFVIKSALPWAMYLFSSSVGCLWTEKIRCYFTLFKRK